MDTNIYLGAPAAFGADILLGYGLELSLPLDDKVRERRRTFRHPEESGIAAWSLFQNLAKQHGISEALRIYQAMEAERKGPFQPGAKYDPDREKRLFVAPRPMRADARRGASLPPINGPAARRRLGVPRRLRD